MHKLCQRQRTTQRAVRVCGRLLNTIEVEINDAQASAAAACRTLVVITALEQCSYTRLDTVNWDHACVYNVIF